MNGPLKLGADTQYGTCGSYTSTQVVHMDNVFSALELFTVITKFTVGKVGSIGIKGFNKCEKKLPPVGLG